LLDRGWLYVKTKDYKAALADYNASLAANSENVIVYLDRGWAHYLNSEYQLSVDDYNKGILSGKLSDTQIALAYTNRGTSNLRLNKNRDAINDYNTALYGNPNLRFTYMMRASALQRNGDYELSNQDYTKALELYKDDTKTLARIYDNRATNYRRLHKFDLALDDIAHALPLAVNPAVLYWNRAALYSETGQCQQAIDEYTRTMGYYKDDKSMLAYMHQCIANEYYTLKNIAKSLEEANAALAIDGTDQSTYFLLGKIYLKHLSKKDFAVKNFEMVIKLDTTQSSTAYIFSQFYLGNKALAMELLKKEVLKETDESLNTISYYNIACMYSIMGDAENANIYLRKVINAGHPKQFAINDEDLDNIRKTPEYIATMALVIDNK
jgi:tetratricopeptide (TPR) repeat protein